MIHKVNFKVVGKIKCLTDPNMQADLEFLSNYLSNDTKFGKINSVVPDITGVKNRWVHAFLHEI